MSKRTSLPIPPTIPEDETLLGDGTTSNHMRLSESRNENDEEASPETQGNEVVTDDWMQESIKLISESHSDGKTALEPLAELKRKQKIRKRKREQYWLPESKDSARKFRECTKRLVFFFILITLLGLAGWYYMKKHPHKPATRTTKWLEGDRGMYAVHNPSRQVIPQRKSTPSPNFSRVNSHNESRTIINGKLAKPLIHEPSIVTARSDVEPLLPEKVSSISAESPAKDILHSDESLNRGQAHPGSYYKDRYAKYFKEHVHSGVWKGAEYTVFEESWENNIVPEFVVIHNVKVKDSLLQINRNTIDRSSLPQWTWIRLNGGREPTNKGRPDWESCQNTEGDVVQFPIGRCNNGGWPHNSECPVYSYSMALHATFFTQRESTRIWWVPFDTGSHWSKTMLDVVEKVTGDKTKYATHVKFGMPEEACVDLVLYNHDKNAWNGETLPWALGREDIYRLRESLHLLTESQMSNLFQTTNELADADIELRTINRHGDRQVVNVKETVEFTKRYFEHHGKKVHYLEAFMDALPVYDQWKSLQEADIIISSHGAQEVNMIGAGKCTAWLEIFPLGYFIPSYYGSMCEQYGMLYYYYYDRDAKGGKPACMTENPFTDPDIPGGRLMPDGGKEDFPLRKCRRQSRITVDLSILERLLGQMLFDHVRCLSNGGPLHQHTDFEQLLRDFKSVYTEDKQDARVLHMSVKEYARPVYYLH